MAETSMNANDLVTCPMCFKIFESPRSLPCCHSFCLNCIKVYCKDKVPTSRSFCPLCKQNFEVPSNGVEDLPRNDHLQRLVDCRKSSCRLDISDVDSGELKALSRRLHGVYCSKHHDQVTTLHCFDCRENVCASCGKTDHVKHQLKSIETFAAELKPQIEADIKEAYCRITDIRSRVERLKTETDKFIEDADRQEAAIKQKGEELKLMIDRKVAELLQELENIKTDSLNSAQAAESRLQQVAEAGHSYCEYSQEIQTKGSAHDVIRYANAIHAQATEILHERQDAHVDSTAPCVVFISSDAEQITTRQLLGYVCTPLSSAGIITIRPYMSFLYTKNMETCYSRVYFVYFQRRSCSAWSVAAPMGGNLARGLRM